MSESTLPDQNQIDAVLRFLPAFKRQGFWFERVIWEGGQVSHIEKSPEARMFLRTLEDNGWILPAGSPRWEADGAAGVRTTPRPASADLAGLQRLFTSWLERDRLLPGHLGALYERGDLTSSLERLSVLRSRLDGPGLAAAGTDPSLRP